VKLMTQAAFARHRGVGRSAVSNWKKAGLLVLAEDPADGVIKVDVGRSDARINGRVDPGRGRPTGASTAAEMPLEAPAPAMQAGAGAAPPENLNTVRLELIRQQTAGHVLKNAREAGELAPVAELQRRAVELGRAARDRMQAWFRGEAERFASEREVRTIMVIGEEGIDRVFAELADMAADGAFGADDEPDEADLAAIEEEEVAAADDEAA
jgi:hypothetical protein